MKYGYLLMLGLLSSCDQKVAPRDSDPNILCVREARILYGSLSDMIEKSGSVGDEFEGIVSWADLKSLETGNIEGIYIGIGVKLNSVSNGQPSVAIDSSSEIFSVIRGLYQSRELWQVWPIVRKLADYSDW